MAKASPQSRADRPNPVASPTDEADLVRRLRAGDEGAFRALVEANLPRMLAVARRMVGEEGAEDVAQEAFLSAYRAIGAFDGEARLSTWLHRITVNAALMRLRSRRTASRREVRVDDLLPRWKEDGHRVGVEGADEATPDRRAADAETRRRVRALIDELPEDHRDVILLRDIEELDTRQTAQVLSVSEGAVKTRLHRARQALRTLLEKERVA